MTPKYFKHHDIITPEEDTSLANVTTIAFDSRCFMIHSSISPLLGSYHVFYTQSLAVVILDTSSDKCQKVG